MTQITLLLSKQESDTLVQALAQAYLRIDNRRQHAKKEATRAMLEDQMSDVLMLQTRVFNLQKEAR